MASVTPYLLFPGNCEEAMEFYARALDGEILALQRFGDAPESQGPAGMADKVLHCVLAADDVIIMASDVPEGEAAPSKSVSLSLDFESLEEQKSAFDALSEGGIVTMELQDTFWGAKFGMVTDRYGMSWMFNYDEDDDDDDDDEFDDDGDTTII